jgi:hypothetical protein
MYNKINPIENFSFQKNGLIPYLIIILFKKKIIFLLGNILYLSITQVEDKYKKYKQDTINNKIKIFK